MFKTHEATKRSGCKTLDSIEYKMILVLFILFAASVRYYNTKGKFIPYSRCGVDFLESAILLCKADWKKRRFGFTQSRCRRLTDAEHFCGKGTKVFG
jgi:hypothetical protein